jgi:hypothetical protein
VSESRTWLNLITLVIASLEQNSLPEVAPTPLSAQERIRLGQLIRTIERGLSTFLEVATSLQEVRSSRLYRGTHADFQSWCRETLGLARSSVDGLIRSGEVAQFLIDSGANLPSNTAEATIRPLASLPRELQPVGWRLVEAASPKCGPTAPVVGKICRVIKNALESPGTVGSGHRPRGREHPSRELAFIAPVRRLSSYQGFDASLVVSHLENLSSAQAVFTACRIMADRCLSCCAILAKRYPELTD